MTVDDPDDPVLDPRLPPNIGPDLDIDADASFQRGCHLWLDNRTQAEAWFKVAGRLGRTDTLHRIIDYAELCLPNAQDTAVLKRRAAIWEFPRHDAPLIHVAPSLFATLNDQGEAVDDAHGTIVLETPSTTAAEPALTRALARVRVAVPDAQLSPIVATDSSLSTAVVSTGQRFNVTRTTVNLIIDELVGAGLAEAYLRPRSAQSWTPPGDQPVPELPDDIAALANAAPTDLTGQSAFTVGVWCDDNLYRAHGEAWFKLAAALGPFETVWRVIDYYAMDSCDWNGDRLKDWVNRAWREEFPRIDAPNIHLPKGLFAPIVLGGCAGHGHDTSVLIRSTDPEAATHALRRAADRFSLVCIDGHQIPPDADEMATSELDLDYDRQLYTPNYVSRIEHLDGHPHLWMDWKDNMAPRMARTMTHLLVDELRDIEVARAWIQPSPDLK